MTVDPIKLVQAMDLLERAEEKHTETACETTNADLAHDHGRCAQAAYAARDAVFDYLNVLACHLKDGEAMVVLNEHLKPEPEASA